MQRQIATSLLAVLLAAAGAAQAANDFVVNTLADSTDAAGSGTVSLRDAITDANGHSTSAITFASNVTGTITLLTPLPALSAKTSGGNNPTPGTITITGPGAGNLAISGGGMRQIFVVADGNLVISDLTLTSGKGTNGGAIDIETATALTASNMVFSSNVATGNGGAIYAVKPITITTSTFSSNSAAAGGAIALTGSGVADSVASSTFTSNTSTTAGAASGISVGIDGTTPTLTLINSTFYNDSGTDVYATKGTANISSVTFGNTQPGAGLIGANTGAVSVRSSVLVGCVSGGTKPTSSGHNIVADNSCGFMGTDDMPSANAALTVFGIVAGTTQTLSPAPNTCTPVTNNGDSMNAGTLDQDGAARNVSPGGGKPPTADIGAIEMSTHLPCIASQPASVTAFIGQPFTLSVTTITKQYLLNSTYETYQWSKNGTAIAGATSLSYSKTTVASDAASYSVAVSNPFGTVTSNPMAVVTVVGPPVFTTQPASTSFFTGGSFMLTAAVQNPASITYQWYLGTTPVGGATSSTLTVNNAQAANAGSYTVKATNPAGTVQSTAATVTMNGPPAITGQPDNQTIYAGKSFTLNVTASGQQLGYQWQKSNGTSYVNISGATANSYTVTSAQLSDAGNYQVVVTNPSGSTTSTAVAVTVNGPPTITVQPAPSTTLFTTQALNLSVTASGTGMTYQWYLNNAAISDATLNTYSVVSAQSTDAGTYFVTVTNGAGLVQSNNAVVTIMGPATITSQPVNTTIYATQALTLNVTASGQQLTYQWQKLGANNTYANISGATASTYTKSNAATTDAGTYRVQVINPGGTTSSNPATVTVNGAPTIGTQPSAQTVYAGQQFQLTVVGNGQGLQYQWYLGSNPISGANASTYTDASAQATDAGSYYVIVSNPAGQVQSNSVAVVVNGPPGITTQPVAQSIYSGQTLTLSVVASGQGLQYQWQKQSGSAFVNISSNATGTTYTLANAQASDAGNYQVIVTNPAGSVTSNSVAVVVNGAPSITAQPQGKSVFIGQQLQLSVTASGQGLQYQWVQGTAAIGGATSATYTVQSAQAGNAGSYTVQVSNPAGAITSSAAVVTISPPPNITQQPQNQTVFTTQTLTLSVTAGGASLTYQWQKQSGASYSNIAGATASSYVVNSAATTDAGNYQVIVTNPAGSVTSSAAMVTINGPPVITLNPVSQMVNAGSPVTLTGNATGVSVTYQWQKGGVDISGATSSSFTINSVQVSDAGAYHLKATNLGGTAVSTDATISVNGAPAITAQPTPQTIFVGQSFALSVTATGTGLSYQWFFKGQAISGAITSGYSVASAQTTDAGAYYVNVTNAAGTVQSNTVAVAVNPAPSITTPPANQTLYATQPLNLSVTASGVSPAYQWLKLSGSSYAPISGATLATYSVASASSSDAGSYEVMVTNGAGSVTSAPAVVVVNGAPQITTNPQSQTVFAGAMVTLTGAASGSVTGYQWQLNGSDIPGATSATLTFASIQVTDAGAYHLKASNPAGTATSTDAVITVNGAPQITAQPAGQDVFATQPFTLTVTASGAALSYQWSLNGTAITGATAATYSVANSSAADAGTYTVLVSNGAGALQSNNAAVVVKPAPAITTQPADQTIFVTQPFTLSVVASGDQLAYQWQLQQGSAAFQNIAGATGSAYSVDSALVSAAGSYQVIITNPAGTITSNPATVNVIGPPAIIANPISQTAFLAQPFALSVTAAGGSLSYQWRLNTQPIAGAQSSTYMVQSAADTDAGAYDVVVSNGAGTATSTVANVTVNGPPTIISDLQDQSLYAGLAFSLTVTAGGIGLHYAWYQNDMQLTDDSNAYSIGSAQLSDAGNYRVVISNGAGSISSRVAAVVIDGAPVISGQPTGATLFAGQPFSVSITATGEDLAYQWRQNEAAIPGANMPTYMVAAAAVTDTGNYDCVVVNPAGSATSAAAAIAVNGVPVITTQPASASIVKGAPLTLSLVAAGTDLQYQWSKDGQPIGSATTSSYAIAAAADTDSGSYTCEVSNEAGSTTSDAAEIAVVQCLADADCGAGNICQSQMCMPKPIPPVYGCANGGAACDPGSSCDAATNSCRVDALVGGCASSEGVTALSLLALAMLFMKRAKKNREPVV